MRHQAVAQPQGHEAAVAALQHSTCACLPVRPVACCDIKLWHMSSAQCSQQLHCHTESAPARPAACCRTELRRDVERYSEQPEAVTTGRCELRMGPQVRPCCCQASASARLFLVCQGSYACACLPAHGGMLLASCLLKQCACSLSAIAGSALRQQRASSGASLHVTIDQTAACTVITPCSCSLQPACSS